MCRQVHGMVRSSDGLKSELSLQCNEERPEGSPLAYPQADAMSTVLVSVAEKKLTVE
jgi:hypothetical protein